jgi:hypothetical protein
MKGSIKTNPLTTTLLAWSLFDIKIVETAVYFKVPPMSALEKESFSLVRGTLDMQQIPSQGVVWMAGYGSANTYWGERLRLDTYENRPSR